MNICYKIIFMLGSVFFLVGCSPKKFEKQKSAFIVFKTKSFSYADLGFIYTDDDMLRVELYGNGHSVMRLDINSKRSCLSFLECLDNKAFNDKILHSSYPKKLLYHLFKAQEIFEGKNCITLQDGFMQKIKKENRYDIEYRVSSKEVRFFDRFNKILIKIREVQQ